MAADIQFPLDVAAALGILHSLTSARAAPIYLSQRNYPASDEPNLSLLFDRFERWHT